jgi:intein/homing endonuclease
LDELFDEHPAGQEWADVAGDIFAIQGDGKKSRITKTFDNGLKEVVRVKLACGMELESTPNHQWWVETTYNGAPNGWKRADTLREGDVLEIVPGVYNNQEHSKLKSVNKRALSMREDALEIKQPAEMTPELAWLLGYLWGDGCLSPIKFRVRFTDQRDENLEKAKRILSDLFGLEGEIRPGSQSRDARILEIGSKHLWFWLAANGVHKYQADKLDIIPRVVRESSKEDIIAFIAGMLDSDGCVHGTSGKVKFVFSTSDDAFSKHLQEVAWSVGLVIGRSLNSGGTSFQKERHMWNMSSTNYVTRDSLELLIRHSTKAGKFGINEWNVMTSSYVRRTFGKVESVESAGMMETFDIEVEGTHWYYAGSVKSHNTISLLNSSSPGMHSPYAPYYIRRIRIAKAEPLCTALIMAGVPFEECVYDKNQRTWVFSFPTKSDQRSTSFVTTETIKDQFLRQLRLQECWADNAVSATLSYRDDEEDELEECLKEFAPRLKSTSFLPKSHGYDQAPYEEITKEKYEEMILDIDQSSLLVRGGDAEIEECSGGVCPIR